MVNRSLVWWVRVPQDLVKGDTLSVVYETREGQEPLVHAVRFGNAWKVIIRQRPRSKNGAPVQATSRAAVRWDNVDLLLSGR